MVNETSAIMVKFCIGQKRVREDWGKSHQIRTEFWCLYFLCQTKQQKQNETRTSRVKDMHGTSSSAPIPLV